MIVLARLAIAYGINLNWVFDPVTTWKRREPFHLAS